MTTTLIPITGNTYPVKEQLKALGARWNGDAKAWMVPEDKADDARKLVAASPVQPRRQFTEYSPRRRYECEDCGDMVWSGTRCWETGLTH